MWVARIVLPLTFVDNCAEAIVLGGLVPGVDGEVFNVVDDELLTSTQFLKAYKRQVKPFFSVRVPYVVAYGLCSPVGRVLQALARPASPRLQSPSLRRGMEGESLFQPETA